MKSIIIIDITCLTRWCIEKDYMYNTNLHTRLLIDFRPI